jgi:hypothetical protein
MTAGLIGLPRELKGPVMVLAMHGGEVEQ